MAMRIVLFVLAALLAIKTSAAIGQDACSGGYVSCVDTCMRGKKAAQGTCIEACQGRTNECYNKIHGTSQRIEDVKAVPAGSEDQSTEPAEPPAADAKPAKGKKPAKTSAAGARDAQR
jgi:hypothetical protein